MFAQKRMAETPGVNRTRTHVTGSTMTDDHLMEDEYKSKSQLKREMHDLQTLGERLCDLAEDQIKALDITPKLRDAALESKRIKKHEARRRHMQYIGKLVRADVDDADTLRELIERIDQRKQHVDENFHLLEQWRDRLVEGDDGLIEDIIAQHPHADRQRIRQLVRNANTEAKKNKPPKSKRALFRYLREVVEA